MKIMAHPSISGPPDLKGKSIRVTRFGSPTDLAPRPVLEQWKLEPNKDVSLVQIGRLSDLVPAIQPQAGRIHGSELYGGVGEERIHQEGLAVNLVVIHRAIAKSFPRSIGASRRSRSGD
jgi:hypothetical protein